MNSTELALSGSVGGRATGLVSWVRNVRRTATSLTLRTKGFLSFAALLCYLAAVALYVSHERQELFHIVGQLEQVHAKQQLVIRASNSLGHSIIELESLLNVDTTNQSIGDVISGVQEVLADTRALKSVYPAVVSEELVALEKHSAALLSMPARDDVRAIRNAELRLIEKLNEITKILQEKRDDLTDVYRDINQAVPLVAGLLFLLGVGVYSVAMLMFYTRLAADLKKTEARALAVVGGYRKAPLKVTRGDEIGGLMAAVNRMQEVLRRSEQQQEISRQQRFHQEKMAAVGSLASAVAHEVNNPMAAISGISQFIMDATALPPGVPQERRGRTRRIHQQAALILRHTERVAAIMCQMSALTERSSPVPELLNLNDIIKATCSFIAYDKRFRRIQFELDLAPLPAITAVADHLTQVLMNLLINAADAMEGQAENKASLIRIVSREEGGAVVLTVADNGHGISRELLDQVFKESFTTKPAGKGRGIGLFLCKMLIEEAGGSIALESTQNVGTTARLLLPLHQRRALASN